MLVIAAAVVVVIAQAWTAQAAAEKATTARRKVAAALEARAQADDAAEEALAELDRILAERVAEPDQATVVQQRGQLGPAAARTRSLSGRRKPKMTPELVDKAQRMYDSRRLTVAEIAQSCAVSPTTIYRHIRTGRTPR